VTYVVLSPNFVKIVECFLRNPANKQTNQQTNADENIISLAQTCSLTM